MGVKPSWLALAIGAGLAAMTAALGIVASTLHWEDHSPVQRVVFFDIPTAVQAVFYSVLPILFLAAGWLFAQRIRNWERGQPDRRATTQRNVRRRLHDLRAGLSMQTLLRDRAAGLMH